MRLFSLAGVERELDREVHSPPCATKFLKYVASLRPRLADSLGCWSDVRRYLLVSNVRSYTTDSVLGPFVQMVQAAKGERWEGIALYVFWDSIEQICYYYRTFDEPAPLFSQVSWSLIRSLHHLNLTSRADLIGKKIHNDVTHNVRAWYRRERDRYPDLTVVDDKPDPFESIPSHYQDNLLTEANIDRSWAAARLRSLAEAGKISRADFQILLGCHLYGRPLDQMARHLGITSSAAKKRRQRAVKKLEKSAPHLSPNAPDSPLSPLDRSPRKEADDADDK